MIRHSTITVNIDPSLCTGCGACVKACPAETLQLDDGKARATGPHCMACAHCAAICPADAVSVGALDKEASIFATFKTQEAWMPYGSPDIGELVWLMRSRRSCRHFQEKAVDRALLEDLAKIGVSAPSGTNGQPWTFTVLPSRKSVVAFCAHIGDFFARLNRHAANPFLRHVLRMAGKPDLDHYYRRYFRMVQGILEEWKNTGRERLFHGAPALIVIATKPGASTPAEDALLASQNILLAAHAMGLGTCLIGFAVAAMRRDPTLQQRIGIPANETVHAVIALGHPEDNFVRCAGRKPITLRWSE